VSKIYLIVVPDAAQVKTAIFDLDNCPEDVTNKEVNLWWSQAEDVTRWFCSDKRRAVRIVEEIAENNSSVETKLFLSQLASLWENLFPAAEEKDAVLGAIGEVGHFLRTSPDVAMEMFNQMRK
jgi:hypothetical protein